MGKTCRQCGKQLGRSNRTGLCRQHAQTDPALKAKRAEGIRKAFKHRPEVRRRQREASAQFNRSPEMRALSSWLASQIKPEDRRKGHTAASARKQAARLRERALAKVPPDQRANYLHLTQVKRIPAPDALAMVMMDEALRIARFNRELTAQAEAIEARREHATC